MAFYAGKSSTISIAGTSKPLDTMEISIDGEPVDVTNFTSSGWQELLTGGGIRSADITASGPYNGIASGASASDPVTSNVAFILTFAAGPALTVTAQLISVKPSVNVRGAAQVTYTARSTGVPTLSY